MFSEDYEVYQDRIKELEQQLAAHGLPSDKIKCQCCAKMFMPFDYESSRCGLCGMSCFKPKGSTSWVRGKHCPLLVKK